MVFVILKNVKYLKILKNFERYIKKIYVYKKEIKYEFL